MAVPCAVVECPNPAGVPGTARGLCSAHYMRVIRHGSLDLPPRAYQLECEFPGCTKRQRGRGYCFTHWKRLRVHGDVHAYKRGRAWTAAEDATLLDLPVHWRSGSVLPGYLADAALVLERSGAAAATRLYSLRGRRLAALRESLRG